jgi:hypothetical protein
MENLENLTVMRIALDSVFAQKLSSCFAKREDTYRYLKTFNIVFLAFLKPVRVASNLEHEFISNAV